MKNSKSTLNGLDLNSGKALSLVFGGSTLFKSEWLKQE